MKLAKPFIIFFKDDKRTVFCSFVEVLNKRRAKMLSSESPRSVWAEVGSLNSVSLSNAICKVKIEIDENTDGSQAKVELSFLKDYLADLSVVVFSELCLLAISLWLGRIEVLRGFYESQAIFLIASSALLLPVAALLLAAVSTVLTKKRIIEDLCAHLSRKTPK